MKVKLDEVAKLAGVGLATVDRVLNERGGVTPATARKVIDAAGRLGWARLVPTLYRSGLRFEVLLGRREIPFFARLNDAFERLLPTIGRGVTVQRTFVDDGRPDRIAEAIRRTRSNALIVYGQEQEQILDAIAAVTSAGIPVVTMVSDLPTAPRLAYVGIDHYAAGRAAAFFAARMAVRHGPLIVLCSSFQYRAQSERVSGFRDGLADYAATASIAALIEGQDNEALTRDLLVEAFRAVPQAVGLYNAGAVNKAVEQALSAAPFPRDLAVIGHDLTADTVRMLRNETMTLVIDQNPDLQARQGLDILFARFGLSDKAGEATNVPFTLHVRDNV